ncbi:MAG: RIP metalloprotease RseP [Flavobacteriaceae bacterium]|nr:RIP metalloprotease RseP [Flavobacteriaceae bacterium]
MTVFIQITQFVLIISILVILHELGHFIPAKLFKTKVEKFYLFFDYKFSLFKKKIGDTVYGIGWIPFGGYVKIAGMIDESMDKEQLKLPPKPWEFRSKPAWQRFIIMIGGVTVNFFLAWFIYSALLVTKGDTYIDNSKLKYGIYVDEIGEKLGLKKGDKIISVDGKKIKKFDHLPFDILLGDKMTVLRNGKNVSFELKDEVKKLVLESQGKNFIAPAFPPVIESVTPNSQASIANIQKGDLITMVNSKPVKYWDDLVASIQKTKNDSLHLTINRNNQIINLNVFVPDSSRIGIVRDLATYKSFITTDEYSFAQSIPKGLSQTVAILIKQVRQFKLIFNKKTKGYKHVKGPIGIVSMMPQSWDWLFIWKFTAMFSVWLAFLNLLPIPALDGGHIIFLLYEMISGRPATERVMEIAQVIGFVIIMSLMVLVFGSDIYHLIFG